MRVSEHYSLGISQGSLEFVDVHIDTDVKIFIDAKAIKNLDDAWADEAGYLIHDYFETVLSCMRNGDDAKAQALLASLSEPNETRLGNSRGRPKGHGMGTALAQKFWQQLAQSDAVRTGLVTDLEDVALFVEGIDRDIVSDITTNIIRRPLVDFTQASCIYHQIPVEPGISVGRGWNPLRHDWDDLIADVPVAGSGPLLLVPKIIVRRRPIFNAENYWRYHVAPFIQDQELNRPISSLVQVAADGGRKVTKKSIEEKYGSGKSENLRISLSNPDVLSKFREQKAFTLDSPDDFDLAEAIDTPPPNFSKLLSLVLQVTPGRAGADAYHRAVQNLLSALFHPALAFPKREFHIHEGRKRIDIQWTNVAEAGFFQWAHRVAQVPCSYVPVECKNYQRPIDNPALDQLAGRFSLKRGKLGLLCYRSFEDKGKILKSCRDTALDDRGWMLPLDDEDLKRLVKDKLTDVHSIEFPLLHERFSALN